MDRTRSRPVISAGWKSTARSHRHPFCMAIRCLGLVSSTLGEVERQTSEGGEVEEMLHI